MGPQVGLNTLEKLRIYFILVCLLACVALPEFDLEVAQHVEFLRKNYDKEKKAWSNVTSLPFQRQSPSGGI